MEQAPAVSDESTVPDSTSRGLTSGGTDSSQAEQTDSSAAAAAQEDEPQAEPLPETSGQSGENSSETSSEQAEEGAAPPDEALAGEESVPTQTAPEPAQASVVEVVDAPADVGGSE